MSAKPLYVWLKGLLLCIMKRTSLFLTVLVIGFLKLNAQKHVSPEQLAVLHLDSLIRTDTAYKDLKFYFDGEIAKTAIDGGDTLGACYKVASNDIILLTPLKQMKVVKDEKLKKVKVPKTFKKDSKASLMEMHRAVSRNGGYVVVFNLASSVFTKKVIILTMDDKGDLVKKCAFNVNDDED